MRLFIVICLSALLSFCQYGCSSRSAEQPQTSVQQESQKGSQQTVLTENREIKDIKPSKPSRIKLHRNSKGEYAWDITGDNPEEVAKTDRRLRQLLNNSK